MKGMPMGGYYYVADHEGIEYLLEPWLEKLEGNGPSRFFFRNVIAGGGNREVPLEEGLEILRRGIREFAYFRQYLDESSCEEDGALEEDPDGFAATQAFWEFSPRFYSARAYFFAGMDAKRK